VDQREEKKLVADSCSNLETISVFPNTISKTVEPFLRWRWFCEWFLWLEIGYSNEGNIKLKYPIQCIN
jgi:hypothetical protein